MINGKIIKVYISRIIDRNIVTRGQLLTEKPEKRTFVEIASSDRHSLDNGVKRSIIDNKAVILKLRINGETAYIKAYIVEEKRPAIILAKDSLNEITEQINNKSKEWFENKINRRTEKTFHNNNDSNKEVRESNNVSGNATTEKTVNRDKGEEKYKETVVYGGNGKFVRINDIVNRLKEKLTVNRKSEKTRINDKCVREALSVTKKPGSDNNISKDDKFRKINFRDSNNDKIESSQKPKIITNKRFNTKVEVVKSEEGERKNDSGGAIVNAVAVEGATVAAEDRKEREGESLGLVEEVTAQRIDDSSSEIRKTYTDVGVELQQSSPIKNENMYTRSQVRKFVRARENAREREIEMRNKIVDRVTAINRLREEQLRSEARIRSMQDLLDTTEDIVVDPNDANDHDEYLDKLEFITSTADPSVHFTDRFALNSPEEQFDVDVHVTMAIRNVDRRTQNPIRDFSVIYNFSPDGIIRSVSSGWGGQMNETPIRARIDSSWQVAARDIQSRGQTNKIMKEPRVKIGGDGQWVEYDFPMAMQQQINNNNNGNTNEVRGEQIPEEQPETSGYNNNEEQPVTNEDTYNKKQPERSETINTQNISEERTSEQIHAEETMQIEEHYRSEEESEPQSPTYSDVTERGTSPAASIGQEEVKQKRKRAKREVGIEDITAQEQVVSERKAKRKISYQDVRSDVDEEEAEEEGKKKTQKTEEIKESRKRAKQIKRLKTCHVQLKTERSRKFHYSGFVQSEEGYATDGIPGPRS